MYSEYGFPVCLEEVGRSSGRVKRGVPFWHVASYLLTKIFLFFGLIFLVVLFTFVLREALRQAGHKVHALWDRWKEEEQKHRIF